MPTLKSFFSPPALLLIVIALLPALLTAYFSQEEFRRGVAAAANVDALRTTLLIADDQNQHLETTRQTLSALSLWLVPSNIDRETCNRYLNDLLFRYEGLYQNILVATPQGEVICSGQPTSASLSIKDFPSFQQVVRTRALSISNFRRDPITDEPVIVIGYPILESTDKLNGVLLASIKSSWLSKQLARIDIEPGSTLTLFDSNGIIIAQQPGADEWQGRLIPDADTILSEINHQDEGSIFRKDRDGFFRRITVVRLPRPYPVSIMLNTAEPTWLININNMTIWAWITILLSLVLFFSIIVGLLVNHLNKPLNRIRLATEALVDGDTTIQLDPNLGNSEMNKIALAFNRLILATRQKMEEHQAAERLIRQQEMQFHAIADLSINWEYWINPNGSYGYISPACERISGYRGDEFRRDWEMLQTIVHPNDRERITAHLKNDHTNEKKQISEIEFRILTKDGRLRWLYHTCQPVLNANREYIGRRAVNQDITERKVFEDALRSSEERNREIINDYGEGIAIVNADGVFTFINPIGEQIFGVKKEVILGHPIRDYIPADQAVNFNHQVELRKAGERTTYNIDIIRADGQRRTLLITANAQVSRDDTYLGSLATFRDITEIHQREEELRFTSTHDNLTGLHNRQYLTEQIARIEKGNEWPISIIVVDMDDLKRINDRFGHIAGDEALKRTANLLKNAFRPGDVIARFGGDEFVILLPGINAEAGKEIFERVETILAEYNTENPSLTIQVSLGLATGLEGTPLEEIFRKADEVMYENKQAKA